MSYTDRNAAYDIARFERHAAAPRRAPERSMRVVQGKKPESTLNFGAVLRTFLLFSLVIGTITALLYSHVQLTEVTAQIGSAQKELNVLKSEHTRLESDLESRISIRNIEEYASGQLGLAKMEKYQIEYINLSGGDKAVLLKTPESFADYNKIKLSIGSVMEYILFSINKN